MYSNRPTPDILILQKAEAQAREAQIELAVERVRAKALAMHKSEEILGVAITLRNELVALNIPGVAAVTIYLRQENGDVRLWDITSMKEQEEGIHFSMNFNFRMEEADPDLWIRKIWDSAESYVVIEQDEQDLCRAIEWTRKYNIETAEMTQQFLEANKIVRSWHPAVKLSNGKLTADFIQPPLAEVEFILSKIGASFDLAYTRFLDLQKAEAQAKEAQIEAALERVRSRTMAMQKSEELPEAANLLFQQMQLLGMPAWSAGYCIWDDNKQGITLWMSSEGVMQPPFHAPLTKDPSFIHMREAYERGEAFHVEEIGGEALVTHYQYMRTLPVVGEILDSIIAAGHPLPAFQIFHCVNFSQGFLLFITYESVTEAHEIFKRFGNVFDQTYTRFLDLQKAEAQAEIARLNLIQIQEEKQRAEYALAELQVTQKQLIQSEKMASLGELTAGIAHEIQNPLNFVNNFSEVSTELVDEMNEEIAKGNLEDAAAIANDLKQNLEKINHHGKRAGDIVKGMLQHSRSSSGQKEPTDINALADEYLRLAYHGLRAKDKSFNATMKTDFDESIGNINIIPQDIGRVILNLITNAFYVVNEKALSAVATPTAAKYEPTVSVSTKKEGNKVLISVKDNGNGIPQKVLDKIFQPFFTTKPTGQGTGLGLSLSYDIVKAHGGELKVETKEGEGSEFIIVL